MAPQLQDPKDPNEACGQMIVVAYKGAKFADDAISRDKAAAAARAAELLNRVKGGEDFAVLAKGESDAPSSAPRGGIMGTHTRDEWPEIHGALEQPLFGLKVHELAAEPIEADYGYVLLRRCPVEKANSRHILVRYKGAKRAEAKIKRSKAEAKARAEELLGKLQGGADFAELAKKESDDSSGERGGDIGPQGRGRLSVAYEEALFGLNAGEKSGVIESDFGFHIIERLPDP